MFKKRESFVENIDSLIGENIKIIGKIEGKGNIRVDGVVEGDIDYDGNIVVGEMGKIFGNLRGDEISLAGTVNGTVSSKSKLTLLPTSTLIGDVEVASFVINENAKFQGNCIMLSNKNSHNNSKEKSEA